MHVCVAAAWLHRQPAGSAPYAAAALGSVYTCMLILALPAKSAGGFTSQPDFTSFTRKSSRLAYCYASQIFRPAL